MNLRTVYTIGESLLDIVFIENEVKTAKPGGSTLNSSVSLGRLGVPVSFISEWGTDNAGSLIDDFLKKNNVRTDHVYRYTDAQTMIAMAFLDKNRDASYDFYKPVPETRLKIKQPEFGKYDILLFSSFFATDEQVRPQFLNIIRKAKDAGAVVIYDPNFRKPQADGPEKELILDNISLADFVRGSDEDFRNIFGAEKSEDAYSIIRENGCLNLIYTANKNGVYVHSKDFHNRYEVPQIKPVSTIGAGDNFNSGLIYGLYKNNILQEKNISGKDWPEIIKWGIEFASDVCMSFENYISLEFADSIKIS